MYVCKHCGFISLNERINYCNNVNCKYYGRNTNEQPMMPKEGMGANSMQKRTPARVDNATLDYDGDFNYPSDRLNDTNTYNKSSMPNHEMDKRMMNHEMDKRMMNHEMDKRMMQDMDKRMAHDMDKRMAHDMDKRMMHDMGGRDNVHGCSGLAFATVHEQEFEQVFAPDEAMRAGTIFACLSMPYNKKILWRG